MAAIPGIRAVIFDWAGTIVDYGSRAPVIAFVELFARHGIDVPVVDVRGPMGTPKKDHIRALLSLPSVAETWTQRQGRAPAEEDVERLYAEFLPLQTDVISRYCDPIPGTAELLESLRQAGIRTGSTTGYSTSMVTELVLAAVRDGFAPEVTVCADDVPTGRPAPWMALRAAMLLDAYPVSSCVKVGDTIADIGEGRNGGMWTVGVTRTGNEIGLSEAEVLALDPADLRARLDAGAERFKAAGANFIIESIQNLPAVLEEIGTRIQRGDRP